MTMTTQLLIAAFCAIVILTATFFLRIKARILICIESIKSEISLNRPKREERKSNQDYKNTIVMMPPNKALAVRKKLESPQYRYSLSPYEEGYSYDDAAKLDETWFKVVPLQNNWNLITVADNAVSSVTSTHFHKWYDSGNLITTDNIALINFNKDIKKHRTIKKEDK